MAAVALPLGLTVLQVGPLYTNHLARWGSNAAALGCRVHAAGHLKPGRRPVRLHDIAETVDVVPSEYGEEARLRWLEEVIARRRPDVIQGHWLPTWGHLAVRCSGPPVLLTPWGSDVYLATGELRRRADWALHRAGHVVARSPHMRRELLVRGVPADRLHDVDLGVDLERFRPATGADRARLRTELGLPHGPLVLSMRAGTELYNLDVVLDAFGSVRRRIADATLVLVHGDAPRFERVRARLSALGPANGVRVIGHLSHAEMTAYVRAATVSVSIPSSDGSPSSVWESLAAGVPVVASALPQIVERVGSSGAVTPVAPQRDAVAGALIELIEDEELRRRMAVAARGWAEANVGEGEQLERLGAVYAAIAAPATQSSEPRPALARGRR
jgi:glycosyltransferase involved in cell wall biosynthesis